MAPIRAHGKVSSMPNKSPIRFLRMPPPKGGASYRIPRPGSNRFAVDSWPLTGTANCQPSTANMYRDYGAWHSSSLGRPMEFLWFGKFGRPVMIFPTSGGRFFENEDFKLTESLADKVDGGEIQLVCVDSIDYESWYNKSVPPPVRAARHAQYDAYLRHEMVPYIFNRAQRGDLAVYGASFGAYHAANFAGRYPDVVSRAVCFSGIYDVHSFLDGYWDETCYFHCPTAYIPNMNEIGRAHV